MIYFTEDDDSIRELVIYTLNSVGLSARGFPKPSAFWEALKTETPDLILLDIMLPEESGLEMLRKLRASSLKKVPVMMLTAKSSEYDKVVGLNEGADDYLAKPFGMMELVARIKALLRRTEVSGGHSPEYTFGKLYVCPAKHIVRVNGADISLTLKEFDLLCLLLENRSIVLTRDVILNKIWGYSFDGESRTVDVHIRTLRQKLGAAGDMIETVRGIGYKIGE